MTKIPQSTIEAMVKARKPPVCQACNGTNFMEGGPAGATYSAPCTHCQDGVPNWAFTEAECMLKAALDEGGVVLESQYSEMQVMAAMELSALREAAQDVYTISERDHKAWRRLRQELAR